MALIIILSLSILFQLSTALYSLWLIRLTGMKTSWILISSALFLMSIRRIIPLYNIITRPVYSINIYTEIIGLVLSLFMFLGVIGLGNFFIERRLKEEKIKSLLSEKETLIRELFHRTKNTLQMIRGIVVLQATEFSTNKEIQKMIKSTENRIQAISLVHQKLYKGKDLSRISMKEYIKELCDLILQSYANITEKISIKLNVDDLYFLLDIAIPLGLILNELITNSIKYAFPENKNGEISISLTGLASNKCTLTYIDNGIGVPEGFNFRNNNTLGLKLIYSIGEQQILGNVEMKNNNGITCFITFDYSLYNVRI